MAEEKTKTGSRARTRVVVKREQSGAADDKKKRDAGSPVVDLDATKASSTTAGQGAASVEAVFRSIAKELIKGGIVVADSVSEFASETGERFKDILAEAKSEVKKSEHEGRRANKTEDQDGHEDIEQMDC